MRQLAEAIRTDPRLAGWLAISFFLLVLASINVVFKMFPEDKDEDSE